MNKHIALVKRWLAGEDVTTEELRANSVDAVSRAYAAEATHAHAPAADAAAAAAHAAEAAARAARVAAVAARWVKKYEELTNE